MHSVPKYKTLPLNSDSSETELLLFHIKEMLAFCCQPPKNIILEKSQSDVGQDEAQAVV